VSCYVSLLPPEATHTLTPHPLLGERLFTYSFVSSFPQGLHDLNVRLRQGRPRVQPRALMTIFGRSVGCCLRPVTSLDPKFWWYIIRRFGSLGGQSWSSLAAGIAARLLHEISLFDKSLYE